MTYGRAVPLLILLCSLASAGAQDRVAQFLLDIRPASGLISPDLDGFRVRNAGNTEWEEISGVGSWTPSLNMGLGLDFGPVNLNITGGGGYLWNAAFHGPFWQADVAVLFESENGNFRIGPHAGVLGLGDADWEDYDSFSIDPQIDLMGNTGFKGGLMLHAGGRKVAFQANFDYVDTSYDVTTSSGWVALDDAGNVATELDMSGFMINLGVIFRF